MILSVNVLAVNVHRAPQVLPCSLRQRSRDAQTCHRTIWSFQPTTRKLELFIFYRFPTVMAIYEQSIKSFTSRKQINLQCVIIISLRWRVSTKMMSKWFHESFQLKSHVHTHPVSNSRVKLKNRSVGGSASEPKPRGHKSPDFSSKLTIFPLGRILPGSNSDCIETGWKWDGMLNFGIIHYTEEHDYAFKVHSNSAH